MSDAARLFVISAPSGAGKTTLVKEVVKRLPGFLATLVIPLGYTALEFINTFGSPLGSWGTSVYVQAGNLPLMQLAAITGMWGITFLMTWLATVINYAWERSFAWPEIRRGVAIYLGVLLLVVAYGNIRLAFFQPDSFITSREDKAVQTGKLLAHADGLRALAGKDYQAVGGGVGTASCGGRFGWRTGRGV